MNGSPELLEFYLVEATEYLDALDQLVGSGTVAPDGNAFIATARALRGSSTMAKAGTIAELSLVIEQIAQTLRDGDLRWTLDLYQSMRGTVDDLRFLVRGVRMWGAREDARADARLADLKRFLPQEPGRRDESAGAGSAAPVFVALQASAIAAELDAFVQQPDRRRAIDDALTRTRTLRGLAGISELPPLADVADAIERVGRALMPDAPLSADEVELFRAAAAVLRRASEELRASGAIGASSDEVVRFARAAAATRRDAPTPASIVPIESLYFADDGPHVLEQGARPAISPQQRLRQELVARGEHVARLVADARQARDIAAEERAVRDLGMALRDMERFATSAGAHQVAAFFGQAATEPDLLAPVLLEALAKGAAIIATSMQRSLDEVERQLAMLERARRTPISTPAISRVDEPAPPRREPAPPVAPVTAAAPPAPPPPPAPSIESLFALPPTPKAPTPAAPIPTLPDPIVAPRASHERPSPAARAPHPVAVPPARKAPLTPTGRELQDLLGQGIAAFAPLEAAPMASPAPIDEDEIVPIESLFYRGDAAIARAIELRESLRSNGFVANDTLQELFDLLDLARAE